MEKLENNKTLTFNLDIYDLCTIDTALSALADIWNNPNSKDYYDMAVRTRKNILSQWQEHWDNEHRKEKDK